MRQVRIGCSGWNYRDWRERLYPQGLPARRWLEQYAELFDTVEVNSTFYRLASRAGGRAVGRADASRLRLRRQGEPVPHAHEELTEMDRGVGSLLRADRAADGGRTAGPGRLAAPGVRSLATTSGSKARSSALPPGRHCFEFRHASWFDDDGLRAPAPARRGARDRRPPRAAVPVATSSPPTGPASASTKVGAGGAATTRTRSSTSGRSRVARWRAQPRFRLLQQRLGGIRRPGRCRAARAARRLRAADAAPTSCAADEHAAPPARAARRPRAADARAQAMARSTDESDKFTALTPELHRYMVAHGSRQDEVLPRVEGTPTRWATSRRCRSPPTRAPCSLSWPGSWTRSSRSRWGRSPATARSASRAGCDPADGWSAAS